MRQERKNIQGWCTIGGKYHFYRSLLERRWACYLEILKMGKEIKDWLYEPERLPFHGPTISKKLKGKTRGIIDVKLDFKVIELNGTHTWHECKGHFYRDDIAKINLFHTYYPKERLHIVMDGLPKGRTKASRKKLAVIMQFSSWGYEIRNARPIFKQIGSWFDRLIILGNALTKINCNSKRTKV